MRWLYIILLIFFIHNCKSKKYDSNLKALAASSASKYPEITKNKDDYPVIFIFTEFLNGFLFSENKKNKERNKKEIDINSFKNKTYYNTEIDFEKWGNQEINKIDRLIENSKNYFENKNDNRYKNLFLEQIEKDANEVYYLVKLVIYANSERQTNLEEIKNFENHLLTSLYLYNTHERGRKIIKYIAKDFYKKIEQKYDINKLINGGLEQQRIKYVGKIKSFYEILLIEHPHHLNNDLNLLKNKIQQMIDYFNQLPVNDIFKNEGDLNFSFKKILGKISKIVKPIATITSFFDPTGISQGVLFAAQIFEIATSGNFLKALAVNAVSYYVGQINFGQLAESAIGSETFSNIAENLQKSKETLSLNQDNTLKELDNKVNDISSVKESKTLFNLQDLKFIHPKITDIQKIYNQVELKERPGFQISYSLAHVFAVQKYNFNYDLLVPRLDLFKEDIYQISDNKEWEIKNNKLYRVKENFIFSMHLFLYNKYFKNKTLTYNLIQECINDYYSKSGYRFSLKLISLYDKNQNQMYNHINDNIRHDNQKISVMILQNNLLFENLEKKWVTDAYKSFQSYPVYGIGKYGIDIVKSYKFKINIVEPLNPYNGHNGKKYYFSTSFIKENPVNNHNLELVGTGGIITKSMINYLLVIDLYKN